MKLVKSVVCVALLVSFVLVGFSASAVAQVVLTPEEEAGLLQMREEEKLAHDIYYEMYGIYNKPIFNTIVASELRHVDAIKTLLDRYGLPDPAAGNGVGVFTNEDIGMLYNDLLAKGSVSLVDALQVGVDIETMDIKDLEVLIQQTSRKDIARVYDYLLTGSENHLAAFNDHLN
jgi:hypothetical protein